MKKNILLMLALSMAFVGMSVFAEDSVNATAEGSVTVDPATMSALRQRLIETQRAAQEKAMQNRKGIIENTREIQAGVREDAKGAIKDILEKNPGKPGEARMEVKGVRVEAKGELQANREKKRDDLTANRTAKVEALKENHDQFKTDMEARRKALAAKIEQEKTQRQEKKTKLQEEAKARVKEQLKAIFTRLSHRIEELTAFDAKVATRLNTLVQAGTDTTAATAQYKIAQTALAKAKTDVEATKAIADTEVSTDTSKETFHSIVKTAEDSIHSANEEYRKTVQLIKPTVSVEATTTTNTSN
jgi:hypothetical protein